ncbi:MAG: Hsp20/alpha crystallin family protein [Solirubrobacterales bacterium]
MSDRDLFANFARMRREMDEMLSGSWGRSTYTSRRVTGFAPNVDVYYCGEPQRAVVKCDLAGIELATVGIEISGRQLTVVGERAVQETEGRVYQQVEIPTGPFHHVVELQVDVDADKATANYEDGILRVDLPLRDETEVTRRVPIDRASGKPEIDG